MSDNEADNKRAPRTAAEWVTFAVSLVVLSLLIGAMLVEAQQSDEPPRPVARITTTKHMGDQFQVTVKVENKGDLAAEAVQVVASLEIDGETTEGDQVVDFLAGDDEAELVFVFGDDPDDGKLTAEVTGFTVP